MKKLITLLTLLSASTIASADIWTVTRGSCFLQKRYNAYARVSAVSYTTYSTGYNAWGQWIGTSPRAGSYEQCGSHDGGCTRPRTAECQRSGNISDITYSGPYAIISGSNPFSGHARITLDVGGGQVNQIRTNSGRGIAGRLDSCELDSTIAASLVSNGWSRGNTSGIVDVTDAGNLDISGISGTLSISTNTDHYSLIKIIIIKERDDLDKNEAEEAETRLANGDFTDIVYMAELRLDKEGVHKSGAFNLMTNRQVSVAQNSDSVWVTLNNFRANLTLNSPLEPNEHLSAVFLSDGGFDVSSAVVQTPQARLSASAAAAVVSQATNYDPEILPNPVGQGAVSIRAFAETENEAITVEASGVTGRTYSLYKGLLNKGANELKNIEVSHLPPGIYFTRINVGNRVFTKKIIKQ
ncbi:MAG: T9SS type A sorting domain-containing protein [Sphingobacteriales bacterium]|nr:MAG: T9SS type A sorting domain-containing protein [Sphingobacteriales bacterium]